MADEVVVEKQANTDVVVVDPVKTEKQPSATPELRFMRKVDPDLGPDHVSGTTMVLQQKWDDGEWRGVPTACE
jgi:hypothetical protein